MKKNLNSVFLLILFLITLVNCSATASSRSLGETLDDGVITNKLKTRYMKDKEVKAFQIDIDTWKGVVSLRGKVDSQDQIYRAIELAEQQTGVKEVKSYLVLRDEAVPVKSSSRTGSAGRKSRAVVEEQDVGENDSAKKTNVNQGEPVANEPDEPIEEGPPQVTPD